MARKIEDVWRRLTVKEDVVDELLAQDDKWGQQDHPDVYCVKPNDTRQAYALEAHDWQQANAALVEAGELAWDGILLEEVYEALSEADPGRLYDELIQVAAVAQQWAECILRRGDREV